ncbi:MAG: TIR domain-containing protein [Woeseiaceae bacterium]
MTHETIDAPFESYQGDGPYLFVSYSHADAAEVYAELDWMNNASLPIWYDEGLHAGDRWNDELARSIRQSSVFLFFVSPRSVASSHCLRELNFAMSAEVPILSIYLEPTTLPDGVQFSIGDRQAIMRSRLATQSYRDKARLALTQMLDVTTTASLGDVGGTNLSANRDRLIGRDAELTDLCELIEKHRMTTVTGAGGSGKSRLSEEAAAEFVGLKRDGVWLVALAPLTSGTLVAQQIAQALGVTEIAGKSIELTLIDYLRSRQMLLLLDNCEHVINDVARVVSELLAQCPDVNVLTTSREALHISGERVFALQPLATALGEDDESPAAALLFAERAASVQSGFELNEKTLPAVLSICERVGGIPLALELAAARCGVMSITDIAERLTASFKALGRGGRDKLAHQQTLRATLQWSYRLLASDEQALLRRISVFSGNFDLAAAEAVCAGSLVDRDDIIDLLERLVDKSLIQADTQDITSRLGLLETVREFARDMLIEEGRHEAVSQRHRDYFLGIAEASAQAIQIDPASWITTLDAVQDNLRVAIQWSLDNDQGSESLRLVGALSFYWVLAGSAAEKRAWYEQALVHLEHASVEIRARALLGAGMAAALDADYENSDRWLGDAIAAFSTMDSDSGSAWARFWQARNLTAKVWSGKERPSLLDDAIAGYDQALAWFIPNQEGFGIIITLAFSAWAAQLGNREDAMERIQKAIGAAKQANIARGEMVGRAHMANLLAGRGNIGEALGILDECIDGLQGIGDHLNSRICLSLAGLIGLHDKRDDYALARARVAVAPDSRLRTREWEPPRIGLAAFTLAAFDDQRSAARLFGALDEMLPSWKQCLQQCGLPDAGSRYQAITSSMDVEILRQCEADGKKMTVGDAIQYAHRHLKGIQQSLPTT